MTDNLFHRLRRYHGSPDREAGEDFLTEAFAWLVSKHPPLGHAFASDLAARAKWNEPIPSDAEVCWSTQVRTSNGIIDMVADVQSGPLLVFEHKVWAELREHQIEDYREVMEQQHPGRVKTVLITARKGQWTQNADVQLTWADVHGWLSSANTPRVALRDDLLEYLRAEGLGPPAPVSHECILSFAPGEQLLPTLTALFNGCRIGHIAPAELR
jgi:hypothetical protein